ncbi:MAG: MFS transporter, partial [Burkholderiaceae bacterium]
AFIAGAMVTPLLVRRANHVTVITTGLFLAALGFGLLSTATSTTHPALVTAAFAIYSLGLAPVFTLATTIVMDSAPPHQAGVVAAVSETASELGGALGIALLGSLGAAAYRQSMKNFSLEGLPPQATLLAKDAFATTIEMGQSLTGIDGASLVDAARIAFMTGLRFGALAAILALLAGAMIALRYLPSRPHRAAA